MNTKKSSVERIRFKQSLSLKEVEIIKLICDEKTTAEIACYMKNSPRTIENHRRRIISKIGCKNVRNFGIN